MVIIQKCSNCGKKNKYADNEYVSREVTLCNYCGHTLTVTGGYIEDLINSKNK